MKKHRRKKAKLKCHRAQRLSRYNFRHGGEKRGNSDDRRRRKIWMLKTFGDGTTAPCTHCGKSLDRSTLEADRIIEKGTYAHGNIQPSCKACNNRRNCKCPTPFDTAIAASQAKLKAMRLGRSKKKNPKLRYKTIKRGRRGILRGRYRSFWRKSA